MAAVRFGLEADRSCDFTRIGVLVGSYDSQRDAEVQGTARRLFLRAAVTPRPSAPAPA